MASVQILTLGPAPVNGQPTAPRSSGWTARAGPRFRGVRGQAGVQPERSPRGWAGLSGKVEGATKWPNEGPRPEADLAGQRFEACAHSPAFTALLPCRSPERVTNSLGAPASSLTVVDAEAAGRPVADTRAGSDESLVTATEFLGKRRPTPPCSCRRAGCISDSRTGSSSRPHPSSVPRGRPRGRS